MADRERAKEESLRWEQEMQERMDAMQVHMESLMKLVETSMRKEASKPKELSVKLVPLTENDDIESYLVMFECIMEAHKIEDKSGTVLGSQSHRQGAASLCCLASGGGSQVQGNTRNSREHCLHATILTRRQETVQVR